MRSVVTYTLGRILIFAIAFGVLYLLGARGALGVLLAFVVSGLVSYVVLSGKRDAISASIIEWQKRRRSVRDRLEEGAAKEDESPHQS